MKASIKRVEFVVMSILFLFLVGINFLLVTYGAEIYQQVEYRAEENFETRTPLSYVIMKLRQNDKKDVVGVVQKDGVEVLVLEETIEGTVYETWIYVYEEALRELYIQKGDQLSLKDGQVVMPLKALNFNRLEKQMIEIEIENLTGKKLSTVVKLNCEIRGDSDVPATQE